MYSTWFIGKESLVKSVSKLYCMLHAMSSVSSQKFVYLIRNTFTYVNLYAEVADIGITKEKQTSKMRCIRISVKLIP